MGEQGEGTVRRILAVISSAYEFPLENGGQYPTGYWAEEVHKPLRRFREAGVGLSVCTVDGLPGRPDPYSLEPRFHYPDADKDFLMSVVRSFAEDAENIRFTLHQYTELNLIAAKRIYEALVVEGSPRSVARSATEQSAKEAWRTDQDFVDVLAAHSEVSNRLERARLVAIVDAVKTESQATAARVEEELASDPQLSSPQRLSDLTDAEVLSHDALFFPGGHGPMVDLANSAEVDRVLRLMHAKGRLIALLCHGPAALLSAGNGPNGIWLFDGFKVAAFSNEEEWQTPIGLLGPTWYLENELKHRGAVYDEGPPWVPHVVVDRNLITAQNQLSDEATAEAVLRRLGVGLELAA
jgi:putative intracellular protease/amidase